MMINGNGADGRAGGRVTAAAPDGFKPPPDLHQAPKVRAATVVKVCPSSPEQRERWATAAATEGVSLSAWMAQAADEKLARSAPKSSGG